MHTTKSSVQNFTFFATFALIFLFEEFSNVLVLHNFFLEEVGTRLRAFHHLDAFGVRTTGISGM